MHTLEIRKPVEKMFFKLSKKNPKQLELISKKIEEIQSDPYHYKNLKKPLNHLRRVHMDKSFVLLFSIKESEKIVIIEDYGHHDNIYK